MNTTQELLFDLMESESEANYYIEREGKIAEKAAFIIIASPIGHFPKKRGDKFTLWFGRGIERWTFKKFKDAEAHAKFCMEKANVPIKVWKESRRGKRTLFAEITPSKRKDGKAT